jgi:hypothetical protein
MMRSLVLISIPMCLGSCLVAWQPLPILADEKPKIQQIELSSIYSTSGQEGLTSLYKKFDGDSKEGETIYKVGAKLSSRHSPPGAFFLRANDISEAIAVTMRGVESKDLPKKPLTLDGSKPADKVWLFVYLQHDGSHPPQWEISPPRQYVGDVRFEYRAYDMWPRRTDSRTADSNPYMYWVPLGEFKGLGELTVELVEWKRSITGSFPKK